MIHTAVIIASGMGSSFGIDSKLVPEGFVEVNGTPIIIQSIETLISCGIEQIIIGTGFHQEVYEALCEVYPEVICCHNQYYTETNSLYTLWNCRHLLADNDFLILKPSLIYEPKAITALLTCKYSSAIITVPVKNFHKSPYIEKDKKHRFVKWQENYEEMNICEESIGIQKISNKFFRKVCREFENDLERNKSISYEQFFQKISNTSQPIHALKINDLEWYNINDETDLKTTETNILLKHKRHTYHTSERNIHKAPLVCYRNERYYGHTERLNKENAAYLLNTLKRVFEENGIELILAYGTLLGAIREHDFIGHDNDMDTMIWGRHMQKGLDLAPELEKYGIKLECYVLPWIFTYNYKGVTCDIDIINEPISPLNKRYCLIQSQYIRRSFFEHTTKYKFCGEMHTIPLHPQEVLEYHYGKNWRIPGGAHARIQSKLFLGYYLNKQIQRVKRFLQINTNRKQILFKTNVIARVLSYFRSEEYVTINNYIARFQTEEPNEYTHWAKQARRIGNNPDEIISEQLFRYFYEKHGSLGLILTNFNGDMTDYKNLQWKWIKD